MNNINEIINRIKKNSEEENKQLADDLKAKLSENQTDALRKLLSDKKLVAELMNSPQAQEILRNIGGDKNGHK